MEFDGFVETFTNEHSLFTNALKGVFLSLIVKGKLTPAALTQMEAEAYRVGKTYYERASNDIEHHAQAMMKDGSEKLVESIAGRRERVQNNIRLTVVEGIKSIMTAARAVSLGASMSSEQLSDLTNTVRAPDGRKWKAEKLVRTLVRDFSYQSMTDRDFDKIARSNAGSLVIKYDAPGEREYENAVVSLEEFAEIRSEVFHINASARVSANV